MGAGTIVTGDPGAGAAVAASKLPPRPLSGLGGARAFLREELAYSDARLRATGRIVLSCTIGMLTVASLQVPNGAWVIITIFVVSMPNAGATLKKGMQRLAGTAVSCALGMILLAAFADVPWLRVPIGGIAAAVAIFLFRTTTAPYAAILGGITFVLFFLNPTADAEHLVAFGLWRALLVATGVVIVVLVDVLFLPTDPERQLLDDLQRRLQAIRAVLDAAIRGAGENGAGVATVRGVLLGGLPREVDLLADAEARHRELRDRHPEQVALITAVERLATESLVLQRVAAERREAASPSLGDFARRIDAIRDGVAAVHRAVAERRPYTGPIPARPEGVAGAARIAAGEAALLASVLEMESALRLAAESLRVFAPAREANAPGAAAPPREELRSPLDDAPAGYFTPGFSLSNRADLQLAMKAGLAEVLVYLFMSGTAWPGIQTGLVTVLVIAGASNGAIVHKAILRCTGATLGGLVGMVAIVAMVPLPTTIVGFLPITAACFAVAAWIASGGPRSSYAGLQTGIALSLVFAETLGPSVDLVPVRDRVMGIVIADMITTLVFFAIWPVFATRGTRRALAASFHALADFSRVGFRLEPENLVRPARGHRWQFYQALNSTVTMHDEAAFEADAGTPEVVEGRAAVRRLVPLAQEVMVGVSAVVRHRVDVDLSRVAGGVAEGLRAYSRALGEVLDAIGDRVAGQCVERADARAGEPGERSGGAGERPGMGGREGGPGSEGGACGGDAYLGGTDGVGAERLAPLLDAAERALAAQRAAAAPGAEVAGELAHAAARLALQRELLPFVERLDRESRLLAPRLAALG